MKKRIPFYFIIVVISVAFVAFAAVESLTQITKVKNENAKLETTLSSYTEKISNYERTTKKQEDQLASKDQQIKDLQGNIDSSTQTTDSESSDSVTEDSSHEQTTEDSAGAVYDTVTQEHRTLYSLAAKNGISLDELLKLNNMTADSLIVMGQKIRVK